MLPMLATFGPRKKSKPGDSSRRGEPGEHPVEELPRVPMPGKRQDSLRLAALRPEQASSFARPRREGVPQNRKPVCTWVPQVALRKAAPRLQCVEGTNRRSSECPSFSERKLCKTLRDSAQSGHSHQESLGISPRETRLGTVPTESALQLETLRKRVRHQVSSSLLVHNIQVHNIQAKNSQETMVGVNSRARIS